MIHEIIAIAPNFSDNLSYNITAIQCALRCQRSKTALKTRRAAAKDLGKLQNSNGALKLEIEQLRANARNETLRIQAQAGER